jgi:hypothetical protein
VIAGKFAWITAKMNAVDIPNSSTPHDDSIAPGIRQFAAGTLPAAPRVDIVSIEKNSASLNEPIAPAGTKAAIAIVDTADTAPGSSRSQA